MQLNDITPERLRSLADHRLDEGHVLSVVLDLDPREFGTGAARASAIRSVLDEARRRVEAVEDLTHDEQAWLRQDLGRVEQALTDDFDAAGAHALAIFASTPADLMEVLRLPQGTPSQVVVDRAPQLAPLARQVPSDRWAVLVLARGTSRILTGTSDRLVEVSTVDADVHGQHQKGGWSQSRYERSVDEEMTDNVRQTAERLSHHARRRPFDHLLVAANDEVWPLVQPRLEEPLVQRLAGRLATDLQHASPEEILEAARPAMIDAERAHEAERLERLQEGLAKDSVGVVGTQAVEDMLEQQRVQTLLVDEDFDEAQALQRMIEAAVLQSAQVLFVRHHDTLKAHGGIGAVLRF